ncbi:hypothetical protein [Liquorilactobacillus hordei]|uniref:Uncharacterized protein n=1 Tax=Liquorilactobacillus hordei DSM 19519 TaxID=1423759 RepID=A0A0R1MWQ3_9LACO|nr:hypothetical protein [Liquorilactobacillus hordei]KRL08008.1 hypothetical protein FC92_GL001080 [Liquorilactobacillus hordei DSM 19519]QYH51046.1 hypothetical protein G6O70_00335 [Liquorilactobacillus hordei DSM 19519]
MNKVQHLEKAMKEANMELPSKIRFVLTIKNKKREIYFDKFETKTKVENVKFKNVQPLFLDGTHGVCLELKEFSDYQSLNEYLDYLRKIWG